MWSVVPMAGVKRSLTSVCQASPGHCQNTGIDTYTLYLHLYIHVHVYVVDLLFRNTITCMDVLRLSSSSLILKYVYMYMYIQFNFGC